MKLTAIQDSFPPCSLAQIEDFESSHLIELPQEYKQFLLTKNGGIIYHDYLNNGLSLSGFFGLNTPFGTFDLQASFENFKDIYSDNYLPIGSDAFGNYVVLSLREEDAGAIYFWDHEELEYDLAISHKLADSIDSFIAGFSLEVEEPKLALKKIEPLIVAGFWAIAKDDAQELKQLVDSGLDVHSTDAKKYSLLHYAALECRLECIEVLANKGADLDAVANNGNTPLFLALQSRSCDCLNLLLDLGASVDKPQPDGTRPLHEAIADQDARQVGVLLDHGANAEDLTPDGRTKIEHIKDCFDEECDAEEISWLIDKIQSSQ